MYCSGCGKQIPEDANYCPFCSRPVAKDSPDGGHGPFDNPVPRRSLLALFFFIIITAGIYEAFWYKRASRFLNGLGTGKRFGPEPFWVFLVGNASGLVLSFMEGYYEGVGKNSDILDLASGVIWLVTMIVLLVMCFRMIASLREYHENNGIEFKSNRFLTFIFNAFYVQYKLNRM